MRRIDKEFFLELENMEMFDSYKELVKEPLEVIAERYKKALESDVYTEGTLEQKITIKIFYQKALEEVFGRESAENREACEKAGAFYIACFTDFMEQVDDPENIFATMHKEKVIEKYADILDLCNGQVRKNLFRGFMAGMDYGLEIAEKKYKDKINPYKAN